MRFVDVVRWKFAFMESTEADKCQKALGFFEYLPNPRATHESFCGYWNSLFVIAFSLDQRDRLMLASAYRNYSPFSPCFREVDFVPLDDLFAELPQYERRLVGLVNSEDDQKELLDRYGAVLREHWDELFPVNDPYRVYERAKARTGMS